MKEQHMMLQESAELAKIPSRDELLSKLLGSLQSPITNFARVINQIAEQGGEAAPAEEAAAEADSRDTCRVICMKKLHWRQAAG